jgi:hypothetical protein
VELLCSRSGFYYYVFKMSSVLKPKVGLYANFVGWSDQEPYEIVKVISKKTIEIRAMDTSKNKTKMKFVANGSARYCKNNYDQEYDYSSNEDNPIFRIRLHKDGDWKSAGGSRQTYI